MQITRPDSTVRQVNQENKLETDERNHGKQPVTIWVESLCDGTVKEAGYDFEKRVRYNLRSWNRKWEKLIVESAISRGAASLSAAFQQVAMTEAGWFSTRKLRRKSYQCQT